MKRRSACASLLKIVATGSSTLYSVLVARLMVDWWTEEWLMK